MRRIKILVLVFILIFSGVRVVQTFSQEKVIPWEKAGEYVGQTVTVEGVIVRAHNSGRACFLNFHPDYQQYLSLVIFASDFNQFPSQPEKYYLNKKVRVRGRILLYQGRPEIILSSPDQIRTIDSKAESAVQPGEKRPKEKRSSTQISALMPGAEEIKEISWEEAADYLGQTVWVRGKVIAANNTGKACFLNFHRNWKRYFTVVIFASAFDQFPAPPEKYYLGKEIRVIGEIREYQGKPEIIVESPEQIEIID